MSPQKLPNGRWRADRIRVGGRSLQRTFDRRADAVAWEAKTRADRDRGVDVDMSNRTTVAEYFEQWYQARVLRPSSVRIRKSMLRHHIEPTPLGSRPLVKVEPSEIQAWVRSRADVLETPTLRKHVSTLRSMFAAAVLDRRIARNPVQPVARLSLPKADKPKVVPLTIDQVRAWADAAEPQARAMILVQAGLGLRISELLGLRVTDVDFMRREVHITEQLDYRGRQAPLKTANSRRVVPLPSITAEVLAEHIRRFPPGPEGHVFTRSARNPAKSRYPRRANRTWCAPHAWAAYREAATAAGLPDSISSHDLRHHYASVLLDAGESVHAVAARLGDTAQMVLGVYGHMMPDREDTTRKAVDAAWKAAGNTTAPGIREGQDHP